jgi:uncharacterized protein
LLAILTDQGRGVARDPIAAAHLYRDAAEQGHRSAQVRWGLKLLKGEDVEQDPVIGDSWLRRAAIAGEPEAAALVGNLYAQSGPMPPNYAEAASWYRRAAEEGHGAAARALASLYLTGAGVPQDNEEAARVAHCCWAGDQASQVELGNLVLEGGASQEDRSRIAGWFEKAALSGDLTAAFNLGVCFAKGIGVERNQEKAVVWLRRAAEGVADAQYVYGRMLAEGQACPQICVKRAFGLRAQRTQGWLMPRWLWRK